MKLIATNISNLTDARFFAAYQPDLMVWSPVTHDSIPAVVEQIDQISEWVQGPRWALALTNWPDDNYLALMKKSNIADLVFVGSEPIFEKSSDLTVYWQQDIGALEEAIKRPYDNIDAFIIENAMERPLHRIDKPLYVLIHTRDDLTRLESVDKEIEGLCLEAVGEVKTGVGNFDDLIDLMDAISHS